MKNKLSKLLAVLLGVMMLAICVPAAAFADTWGHADKSVPIEIQCYAPTENADGSINENPDTIYTEVLQFGSTITLPTSYQGHAIKSWSHGFDAVVLQPGVAYDAQTVQDMIYAAQDSLGGASFTIYAAAFYATYDDSITVVEPETPAPSTDTTAAASAEDSTPAVDTRTAQQKEIDEAIANGTWGIEYTTCQKCGYHNWTRKGNVYVCDTCGNETTTVVGPKGVKGYVGSGAIAPIAKKAEAPETRYATAKQAQAAADKREADYAAAVAAFQKQIAAQEAAYLASLGK